MRSPSPRILNQSVTVERYTWGRDASAGRTRTVQSTATLAAAVHPTNAAYESRWQPSANVTHLVIFAADPALKVEDVVVWRGLSLVCQSPALDQAGMGGAWVVECEASP